MKLRPLKKRLNKHQWDKRLQKIVKRWYERHPLSDEARHALTGE